MVAEDFDGPSNNHVRYSIVDGNQGSPFTLDPLRGELKVAHQLDRERVRKMSNTTLFTCSLICWETSCSRCKIQLDSRQNVTGCLVLWSLLHYCLEQQLFSCMVILALLFSQTSGYTVLVVASDNGVPPLSSSATINIDISDVNDNPPLFSQANYTLIIQVRMGRGGCADNWLERKR